jgi:CRISPR-associated endonuclease/helicase Cas3
MLSPTGKMFYAHSTADPSRQDWQGLRDHLVGVANLSEQFGSVVGIAKSARLAGLLHDLGKYSSDFQARLDGSKKPVDHSTAGAHQVLRLASGRDDKIIAELIAYAIAGHHAGLPDKVGATGSLSDRVADFDSGNLDPIWQEEIQPDASGLMPSPRFDFGTRESAGFRVGFLGRMLFSCLVDADYKDTETFYQRVEGRTVDRTWPDLPDLLPNLLGAFDRHMSTLSKSDSKVNRLRAEILGCVRLRAAEWPGLFTLTVPTGGGKTLASLGFALEHARRQGLRRILYVIPFTSIIDQTAEIFRDVLGADIVLEHHSAIDEEAVSDRQQRDKLKLAMEDWAAPIVVTTNVQFFESLFAARPSRCRKLHNIARSVIILDEAQTLPRPLLAPCVRALDELARNYGCSIVLCTATQPALAARNFRQDHPMGLALAGRELAPDPARLATELRRVTIQTGATMSNADLVESLRAVEQGLVIVNSRRHALDLFRAANEAGLEGLVHLTTRQYAAHRREILAEIRRRLQWEGEPCRVVATSLVEAGVDLDFPRVWRAEAGLDQIAQAAGRCNREGKRDVEASIVTVFGAPDYPPPAEIKGLSGDLARIVGKFDDLLSPAALEAFFGEVYWRLGADLDRERILDSFRMDRTGTCFDYRSVGDNFRLIESGMEPVIIARDEKARGAVENLGIESIPSGAIARELQSYVVLVPPKARTLLIVNGHVRFVAEKERGAQFAVLQADSLYAEETGLIWEDAEYLTVEAMIL